MNISKIKNEIIEGVDSKGEVREFRLSDFLSKTLILYFYPNDGTRGCTIQACDFRDNMPYLAPVSFVVGVNRETCESHKKFIKNEELNFPLLSDTSRKLIDFFGVWGEKPRYGKGFMGIIRSTFLINKEGEIFKKWTNVNVEDHIGEIFNELNIEN